MLQTDTRLFCLVLLLCLIGALTADLSAGGTLNTLHTGESANTPNDTLTLSDSDDDDALPVLLTMAALLGLICSLMLPGLLDLSQRWPPLLQPPQSAN